MLLRDFVLNRQHKLLCCVGILFLHLPLRLLLCLGGFVTSSLVRSDISFGTRGTLCLVCLSLLPCHC